MDPNDSGSVDTNGESVNDSSTSNKTSNTTIEYVKSYEYDHCIDN